MFTRSHPSDLQDSEIICRLTAMLLSSKALKPPRRRRRRSGGETARRGCQACVALEALSRGAGSRLPSAGDDGEGSSTTTKGRNFLKRGAGGGAGGGPKGGHRWWRREEGEVAAEESKEWRRWPALREDEAFAVAAMRIVQGDFQATLDVLSFLREALGGDVGGGTSSSGGGGGEGGADGGTLRSALRQSFSSRRGLEGERSNGSSLGSGSLSPSPTKTTRMSLHALEVLSGEIGGGANNSSSWRWGNRGVESPGSISRPPSSGGLSTLSRLASGNAKGGEDAAEEDDDAESWASG